MNFTKKIGKRFIFRINSLGQKYTQIPKQQKTQVLTSKIVVPE